jgi:hypothetical protein
VPSPAPDATRAERLALLTIRADRNARPLTAAELDELAERRALKAIGYPDYFAIDRATDLPSLARAIRWWFTTLDVQALWAVAWAEREPMPSLSAGAVDTSAVDMDPATFAALMEGRV